MTRGVNGLEEVGALGRDNQKIDERAFSNTTPSIRDHGRTIILVFAASRNVPSSFVRRFFLAFRLVGSIGEWDCGHLVNCEILSVAKDVRIRQLSGLCCWLYVLPTSFLIYI